MLDLQTVKLRRLVVFVTFLSLSLSPGFLYLLLFAQSLFVSLDFARLLMLSLAISCPIVAINTVLGIGAGGPLAAALYGPANPEDDVVFGMGLLGGGIISIPTLYLPLAARIFVPFGPREALAGMLAVEAVTIATMVICIRRCDGRAKRPAK